MKKYEVTVTNIGEMAQKFFGQKIIVLFSKKEMPLEMQDISIMHSGGELAEDVKTGDKLYLGSRAYIVTAVGEKANNNLRLMGHVCLKFDGKSTSEMPGDIHLKGNEPLAIDIGEKIIIENAQ
ncbi:PTS system glucitol/sorbitol-specific IIA component [Tepidanaerobacter acetatoxydans Re1]|uniref:PTS system glucitol/sorbitol-specific IIA component n=1 Tax=Tepidanaerobacter acetatoxydans (strain DSM 21804 / JCM 16047 / Re1) TaxID=1209989 RepID=F4LRR8_TEPAE|nr:PTS glucitol/sorbitol transporter subunit IIA [Tepidanaerobacter acetatoxydans]AEE91136.1 PTS system glucitol/sorbitol-specific IIA component [Tepidanaerobacter acetatoxydans Re1]CCP25801.1 PTS system glucitol/sorbitol-specific IIA component [Tepidanaerobacter acetatoxydans Re1]